MVYRQLAALIKRLSYRDMLKWHPLNLASSLEAKEQDR